MNENQVQDELVVDSEDDNLFADYEEDGKPAESLESDTAEEAEKPAVEPAYNLKVKYNGEDKDLTEDEARSYVQKGMNYDKFYQPLERLARLNNMSVDGFIHQLNDTQFNYEVSREVDRMKEDPKYQGVSEEILEEIANSRVTESMDLRDKNYEEQKKGEADAQQERVQREIDMFMDEYPEFRDKGPDSLDPKVFEYTRKGYTLLEAYNKWQREEAERNRPMEEAKAKVSKLNEDNRRKSLGNTTNAGSVETDDFLSGFLKG